MIAIKGDRNDHTDFEDSHLELLKKQHRTIGGKQMKNLKPMGLLTIICG